MYDSTTVNVEGQTVRLTALGPLGELGLGAGKIESDYSREQAVELAKELVANYLEPIPEGAERKTMCGDGRDWEEFADGSHMLGAYPREMGADGTAVDQLIIGDAPVLDDISKELAPQEREAEILQRAGIDPSGHFGCGYQDKRPAMLETIATKKDQIAKFVSALPPFAGMNVRKYMDVISERASTRAEELRASEWDGKAYIAAKAEEHSGSVARLEGDPSDHVTHGHREKIGLVLVAPGKSINTPRALAEGQPQAFIINADRMVQRATDGANDAEDQKRLLVAGAAIPAATADVLTGPGMQFVYAEVIE